MLHLPTHDPKRQAWQVLDSVQFFRNFTEVKQVLPGIPTEPPWKWLAHVIVLAPEKRPALRETLLGKLSDWEANVDRSYIDPEMQAIAVLARETLMGKLLRWEADVDALYSNPVIQAIAVSGTPDDRPGLLY